MSRIDAIKQGVMDKCEINDENSIIGTRMYVLMIVHVQAIQAILTYLQAVT